MFFKSVGLAKRIQKSGVALQSVFFLSAECFLFVSAPLKPVGKVYNHKRVCSLCCFFLFPHFPGFYKSPCHAPIVRFQTSNISKRTTRNKIIHLRLKDFKFRNKGGVVPKTLRRYFRYFEIKHVHSNSFYLSSFFFSVLFAKTISKEITTNKGSTVNSCCLALRQLTSTNLQRSSKKDSAPVDVNVNFGRDCFFAMFFVGSCWFWFVPMVRLMF